MFLLELPPILGSLIAMLLSVAFTALFFVSFGWLFRGDKSETEKKLSQQMAFRVGVIHALIIALVFGMLAREFLELQENLDDEAVAVINIYYSLDDLQSDEAKEIQKGLLLYVREVINKEWKFLDEKKLSPSAEQILVEVSRGLANWRPSEPLEAMIKTHALKKLNWISDLRYQRLFDTYGGDIPSIFWIVAVAGFILTLIPYLIYELSKLRFVLLSCYAAMIGIAFYSIALLNNPFIGHLVSPKAFEVVYMEMNKEVESETSHGLSSSKTVPAKSPKASD